MCLHHLNMPHYISVNYGFPVAGSVCSTSLTIACLQSSTSPTFFYRSSVSLHSCLSCVVLSQSVSYSCHASNKALVMCVYKMTERMGYMTGLITVSFNITVIKIVLCQSVNNGNVQTSNLSHARRYGLQQSATYRKLIVKNCSLRQTAIL